MKKEIYRQGDVMIIKVDSIPTGLEPRKRDNGKIVLAYGEVTFHTHAIKCKDALAFNSQDEIYLDLKSRTEVLHEEHNPIPLNPGFYRVIHQKEFGTEGELVPVQD